MRSKSVCFCTIIVLLLIFSGFSNANVKFRELSWVDPPQTIEHSFTTKSDYDELGVNVYRKNENLSLGSVVLNRIEYHFFDDERDAAKAMLKARYGKGRTAFLANKSTWTISGTTMVWDWPFPAL